MSIAVAASLAGCGGELPESAPPAFDVQPGQVVPSTSGRLTVSVWTAPSPPVKGVNALRFGLADGTGGAVEAADVSATAWMPAHGHGTSVKPAINEVGGGLYEVTRVVFFMDGRWEVRGEVKDAAGVEPFVATFDVR
jgi:hypothetical protein